MKKIVSLILVLLLLLTAAPFVYAEENNSQEVATTVQFGSYPQTQVTDEELIALLDESAPEWEEWISYGYSSGTGSKGTMITGDWMRYIDISVDGTKYRGVCFVQYRPQYVYSPGATGLGSYQDDNGFYTETNYWFEFEPVTWKILDYESGLVVSEISIDAQPFNSTIYYNSDETDLTFAHFIESTYKNYACNYEFSTIRAWLNNEFYNTAFSADEKTKIETSTISNNGYYTLTSEPGYEALDSSETTDKIFLLAYDEVLNSELGFNSSSVNRDAARKACGSDYAKCQGLYVYTGSGKEGNGNSYWILRSAGVDSYRNCNVHYSGGVGNIFNVASTYGGIRPACIYNGLPELEVPVHKHKDEDSDNRCDVCDFDMTEPCNCKCHLDGFAGFIGKILLIVWKLFNIKNECACGIAHY